MRDEPVLVRDAIPRYLADLGVQGRSPKTIRMYARVLAPWQGLAAAPNDLAGEDCEQLARLHRPSFVRIVYAALNGFFRYSMQQGWMRRSPMRDVEAIPPAQEKRTAGLTRDELNALWSAAAEFEQAERNKLILVLLMHGFTSSELVALRWSDLDLENKLIRSTTARGKHERTLALHPLCAQLLMSWEPKDERIIPLTGESIRLILRSLGRRARIGLVRPYQFRHTLTRSWIETFLDSDALPTRGRWAIDRQRALDHPSRLLPRE